jgi:16S rRNA (guanine1207-N2)-methyltransferase
MKECFMSAFTPASEVLLRHSDDFEPARVLFAGDLQDDLPARLDTAASRAHTQQFHHWQALNGQMGETYVLVWSLKPATLPIATR